MIALGVGWAEVLHIISLGAGVQSSTMALMAAHGEITPMPDAAIFADTMGESWRTYDWLLQLEKLLPFPLYRVSAGDLGAQVGEKRPKGKYRKVKIPAYVGTADDKKGLISRDCTTDYKITPIKTKVRQLAGIYKKRSPLEPVVFQWIGMSTNEASRMKPSGESWRKNIYPLIDYGISLNDCKAWLLRNNYPIPFKSSCVFCPFHSDAYWKSLDPRDWDKAELIDAKLREHPPSEYCDSGPLYLHPARLPISVIRNFLGDGQADMFENECEGVCGV